MRSYAHGASYSWFPVKKHARIGQSFIRPATSRGKHLGPTVPLHPRVIQDPSTL